MLDFISNCKQKIIKYKKQLFTFALIPVFMFRSSLSGFAVEVSPDAKNEWFLLPFNFFDDYSAIGTFDSTSGTYNLRGGSQNDDYLNFSVDVNSSGFFQPFYHSISI